MSQEEPKPVTLDYANPSLTEEVDPTPPCVRFVLGLTICVSCLLLVFSIAYVVHFEWPYDLSRAEAGILIPVAVVGLAGIVLARRTANRKCATSSSLLAALYLISAIAALIILVVMDIGYGMTEDLNPLVWIWLPVSLLAAAWILRGWSGDLRAGAHDEALRSE